MTKCVVFINQSPNSMLHDIAEQYVLKGYKCILLAGYKLTEHQYFSEQVVLKSYNRSSAWSRLFSWWTFYREAASYLKKNADSFTDLFVVSNPPFLLYLPLFNSHLRKKKLKALIYDLYPDVLKGIFPSWISFLPVKILGLLNRKGFSHFKYIYAPSLSLGKKINQYSSNYIITVYNWVDLGKSGPVQKENNSFLVQNNLHNKFIVLYSGNLGATHDTSTILGAMQEENNCHFVMIGHGEGMEELRNKTQGLSNVSFFGWQDEKTFPHSIACGDVAWVSYLKGNEEYSIPSKLPYYLASGTPVIMIGNKNSELALMLTQNKIGYCVANNDVTSLTKLLNELQLNKDSAIHEQCIRFAKENFSKHNALKFTHDL